MAVNFSLPQLGVTLAPKFYYDFGLKGPTGELTAQHAFPLKEAGTELDFTATVGTYLWRAASANTSPDVKNWGDYWLVGVAAPFAISPSAKVTIGWAYTKGSNNYYKQGSAPREANTAAVGRGVVTVSCAFSF